VFEIVKPGTNIDFIGKRKVAAFGSLALLVAALAAVFINGINWGIDFAGGTEMLVRFDPGSGADEGAVREIAKNFPALADLEVVRYGTGDASEFLIRFQDQGAEAGLDAARGGEEALTGQTEDPEAAAEALGEELADDEASLALGKDIEKSDRVQELEQALAAEIGPVQILRVDFVGPRVGEELRTDGVLSLLIASLAILVYIAFRFSSRFAPGAIAAVVHDLLITAGIFVILGLEFDLRILAAMLAILGYSLNDTIIIYDRIRENIGLRTTYDLPQVLNQSVNQTLSRTVLTSGTTLLALLSLFFLGGEVIRPFAFAMIVGVLVGTYSSIYIAAPVLLYLESNFGDDSPPTSSRKSHPAQGKKAKATRA